MKERRSNRVRDGPLQGVIKMKKWIVMLAMLSLLTACAQAPEPESAELTELSMLHHCSVPAAKSKGTAP